MGYRGDETTGFQSPAQDFIEGVVDLPALLDLRRPGRYPVRVKGQELRARGIWDGDNRHPTECLPTMAAGRRSWPS